MRALGGTLALRGIAAGLIVLAHANLALRPDADQWWPGGFWLVPLLSVPVPLFFLLAGYATPSGTGRRRSLWDRLRRLVPPYLVWNAGLLLFYEGIRGASGEWLLWLFTGFWHLYFLFVLIQLRAIEHFLARLGWLDARRLFLVAAIMALAFFAATELALWRHPGSAEFFESVLDRTILPWALFYFGGMLLRVEPRLLPAIWRARTVLGILAIASYFLYVAELRAEAVWAGYTPLRQFLSSAVAFDTCALLWLLAVWGHRTPGRTLQSLGRESYGIYLAHAPLVLLILAGYDQLGVQIPFGMEPPALWLLALLASWGLVKLVRHLPWGWLGCYLFGIRASG